MIGVQEADRSPSGVQKEGSDSEMLIEGASEVARADAGGEEMGEGVEVMRECSGEEVTGPGQGVGATWMCSGEEVAGPGEGVGATCLCSDGSDKAMGL